MLPPFTPEILTGCQNLDALTLKMTTAQVVETSVTVNNNSPIQDYVHRTIKLNLLLKEKYFRRRLAFTPTYIATFNPIIYHLELTL